MMTAGKGPVSPGQQRSTQAALRSGSTRAFLTVDIVAARAGVTVRRVRYLYRVGLVEPASVSMNELVFDHETVERIQIIERLTSDLGVNLPGAEVILHMRERLLALMDEIESMRE
ncbi:hypothetical protein BH23CHL5_BH23CHL5_01300 [soil metagenome]